MLRCRYTPELAEPPLINKILEGARVEEIGTVPVVSITPDPTINVLYS